MDGLRSKSSARTGSVHSPMANKKKGCEINTFRDWPERSLSSAQGNVGRRTEDFVLVLGRGHGHGHRMWRRTHNAGAMTVENRGEIRAEGAVGKKRSANN